MRRRSARSDTSKKDPAKPDCNKCSGKGQVECYECHGTGTAIGPDGKPHPCVRTVTCTDCGGSGKQK